MINVHDSLNILDTASGGKIVYQNGVEIGDSGTSTVSNTEIAIGKTVTTSASNAIAIGSNAVSNASDAVAIGPNITANQVGGLFVRHRGPVAVTFNAAGFIPGTNELVEIASSRRFKDNIRDLEEISPKFDLLRPVRYTAKAGYGDNREHIGFIAEEVLDLFPEMVTFDGQDNVTGMMFDRMVAVVVKEVHALKKRVAELEAEVSTLKQK
jgi:hypothetical protein